MVNGERGVFTVALFATINKLFMRRLYIVMQLLPGGSIRGLQVLAELTARLTSNKIDTK
jgi:hypothetical protein